VESFGERVVLTAPNRSHRKRWENRREIPFKAHLCGFPNSRGVSMQGCWEISWRSRNEHAGRLGAGGANRRCDWDVA